MITVRITYDPYHMTTSMNIGGVNVKRATGTYDKIKKYVTKKIPLQSWLDASRFQDWKGLLLEIIGNSNEDAVHFVFRGREIDFLDLQEAMEFQKQECNNGLYDIDISYDPHFIYDDKTMMRRVQQAYDMIQSDGFKKIIEDKTFGYGEDSQLRKTYGKLKEIYDSAMDSEFRIVFSGMYTCGKSTLINAVLGKELLPSTDGTCTSKIFRILHDPSVAYAKMYCVNAKGKIVVPEEEYTEETLAAKFAEIFPRGANNQLLPSNPPSIDAVIITTDISSLYPENAQYDENSMRLVVIDTPGTSSGEGNMVIDGPAHIDITRSVIESDKKEMIILATSAIEDKDDSIQTFLDMVDRNEAEGAYDQRFLFVLNKADVCTFKPGENWEAKLQSIRNYYIGDKSKNRTLQNPRFFPTSAVGALKVKTGQTKNDSKYNAVQANYFSYDDDEECWVSCAQKELFHFDEHCAASQSIKEEIKEKLHAVLCSDCKPVEKRRAEVLYHSGIPTLELAIRDYIEKYAFPLKIQTLLATYETIFKEIGQVLKLTSTRFDEALAAKADLEKRKQQQEQERQQEKAVQESLVAVTEMATEKKKKLEELAQVFIESSLRAAQDIKITMNISLEEAKKTGKSKSQGYYGNEHQKKVQAIVENGAQKCYAMLSWQLQESGEQVEQIEREILQFFEDIKDVITFDRDFSIQYTTAYQQVSTSAILKVRRLKRTVRNPDWDSGFFLFRPIKRLFISKTIEKDDGLDMNALEKIIADLRAELDANVDRVFNENKTALGKAIEILVENIDQLDDEVREYADRISGIGMRITALSDNIEDKAAFVEDLKTYRKLIETIQKALNFENEEME
jgi:hypothetical protein